VTGWARAWWRQSVRHRLWVVAFVPVLLLAALGLFVLRISEVSLKGEVEHCERALAEQAARDVHARYSHLVDHLAALAGQLRGFDYPPAQSRRLAEARQADPLTLRALYVLDAGGRPLASVGHPGALPEGVLAAYRAARASDADVSITQVVGSDRMPIAYVAMPLHGAMASARQFLVAELDLRTFWGQVDELSLGRTGHAFITTREGLIFAHPERSLVGEALPAPLRPVLEGFQGQAVYRSPFTGRTMLAAYSPVCQMSGWGVVVEQEEREALGAIRLLAGVAGGVLAVAVVAALLLTYAIGRSITGPLIRLQAATQAIAQSGDIGQTVAVAGQDEIGRLAATFNAMLGSLRQASQALRESERNYRLLAETARDIILVHDMEGRIVYVNEAGLQMSGYSAHEVARKTITDFLAPEYREAMQERLAQRQAGDERRTLYEVEFINRAGERVPVEVSSSPIVEGGKVTRILIVARDIGARREAEAELARYREQLEAMVAERTAELTRLVRLMAGRERRMAELKDAIRRLRAQAIAAGLTPAADDPLAGDSVAEDESG
jgi:PAS domain S-box-containing protein